MVPGIYAVHWKFFLTMCTATRTSSYSPVGPSVFFVSIFSVALCFACLFVLFDLFVSSLTVFGASVNNLNEPPRALATSTFMWVRS